MKSKIGSPGFLMLIILVLLINVFALNWLVFTMKPEIIVVKDSREEKATLINPVPPPTLISCFTALPGAPEKNGVTPEKYIKVDDNRCVVATLANIDIDLGEKISEDDFNNFRGKLFDKGAYDPTFGTPSGELDTTGEVKVEDAKGKGVGVAVAFDYYTWPWEGWSATACKELQLVTTNGTGKGSGVLFIRGSGNAHAVQVIAVSKCNPDGSAELTIRDPRDPDRPVKWKIDKDGNVTGPGIDSPTVVSGYGTVKKT